MAQIDLSNLVQFLVGIIDVGHLIHQPSVTIRVRILDRHRLTALQRQDEVFGVEHVQYRTYGVALHQRHIALGLSNGTERTFHLLRDIGIDEFLITA